MKRHTLILERSMKNFFVLKVLFNVRHKEWVWVSKKECDCVGTGPVRENSIVWGNEAEGGLWNGVARASQVKEFKLHPACRGSFQVYERAFTELPA